MKKNLILLSYQKTSYAFCNVTLNVYKYYYVQLNVSIFELCIFILLHLFMQNFVVKQRKTQARKFSEDEFYLKKDNIIDYFLIYK